MKPAVSKPPILSSLCVFALLHLIGTCSLAAEQLLPDGDWPHLRGPNYNAVSTETGLADSWPAEGPPVLWTREIGCGYSGMIVVGNRLYTQTQTLTKQKVVALDADTGRTIWEHNYDWPFDPGGMYPGPRATPTFSHDRIYFASPDGLIGCLAADTGRPIWSVNVKDKFDGRGTDFGYSCTPLVEDGKVILPVGGPSASMVALDAESGATVWAAGKAPASYSSAIPITFHGTRQGGREMGTRSEPKLADHAKAAAREVPVPISSPSRQVVAFLQNELAGFDLKTGRPLWRREYSKGYDEHSAFLLYDEPYLRTTQPFRGGSDLYILEEAPAADKSSNPPSCQIRQIRHDERMSNDVASSVLLAGFVYGFDLRDIQTTSHRPSRGEFRCLDFKTGDVRWSSDRPGQATIVAADGKLLLFNDRGEVLLLRADPNRYEELARTEVFRGEICWTAPALSRGRLYVRNPTRIACLYVGKPEQMDPRQREHATPTSTIPKATRIDLSWLTGGERECPFELPNLRELTNWYAWSLAALVLAGLLAACVQGALRFRYGQSARFPARIVFWLGVLVFGVAATPLANRYSSEFVLTWSLSLFAVHQIALAAVRSSSRPGQLKKGPAGDCPNFRASENGTVPFAEVCRESRPASTKFLTGPLAAWSGLAGVFLLMLACLAYYQLTRSLSLSPGWYFLMTFVAAWPVAVPAVWRSSRSRRLLTDFLWMLAGFSLYFWASAGLMLLRTAIGR